MITTAHFLLLAAALFFVGTAGVLVRRNILVVLMSLELMLSGGNLTLLAFARHHGSATGHGFAFMVIAVAAAEAAVGLAIVVSLFRWHRSVHADDANILRDNT